MSFFNRLLSGGFYLPAGHGQVAFEAGGWLLKPFFTPGQEKWGGKETFSCLMGG